MSFGLKRYIGFLVKRIGARIARLEVLHCKILDPETRT